VDSTHHCYCYNYHHYITTSTTTTTTAFSFSSTWHNFPYIVSKVTQRRTLGSAGEIFTSNMHFSSTSVKAAAGDDAGDITIMWVSATRHHILHLIITHQPSSSCYYHYHKLCGRPPQYDRTRVTLTFDLKSGIQVTCDVGYIWANFSLPRPLCSRLRSNVCDRRQTASSINALA